MPHLQCSGGGNVRLPRASLRYTLGFGYPAPLALKSCRAGALRSHRRGIAKRELVNEGLWRGRETAAIAGERIGLPVLACSSHSPGQKLSSDVSSGQ